MIRYTSRLTAKRYARRHYEPKDRAAPQASTQVASSVSMHSKFEEEETDAILLIDASNAFNTLNRAAALHNIRVLCPPIATYATNTYRQPARLFITGGSELKSAEVTTQGDSLAVAIYAISLQPLITRLGFSCDARQCWYADDASGSGSLEAIKQWWDQLTEARPNLGYYPNAKKCWLITKPEKVEGARVILAKWRIG